MTQSPGPTDGDVPSDAMSRDVPPAVVPGGDDDDRGNVPEEVYEDGLESGADEPS
ncbi:hypothetical protein SAMN06893096_10558 [Geodermatophilus pulveris]|uniref:Uncharacterized protein n=1 Tax=Geodermatophilus pulveris TaxID=1564159 RepID=A0A239FF99_9ACTN|nr:hypothetical protein [Geodermatophilus pulveris]SNS55441.1 hypothetical protein SAMN06893096_10558 [Geodermatophilus pulveris]